MPGLNRTPTRRRTGPTVGGSFSVQVLGAERLAEVAKALKAAGDNDLRKQLYKGLRSAAKPLIADARQNARQTLPKHGELNERVARSKFKVSIRGGGRSPGVRISATGLDARLDTQGRLRHPTFGRRGAGDWFEEKVKPHWFTDPMRAGAPKVRRELLIVLGDVARKIEKA